MRFRDLKIRTQVILLCMVFIFPAAMLMCWWIMRDYERALVSEIKKRHLEEAANVLHTVGMTMHECVDDVRAFTEIPVFSEKSSPQEMTRILKKLERSYHLDSVSYFGMDRVRIADSSKAGQSMTRTKTIWGRVAAR